MQMKKQITLEERKQLVAASMSDKRNSGAPPITQESTADVEDIGQGRYVHCSHSA
jgi:hypothetical protein